MPGHARLGALWLLLAAPIIAAAAARPEPPSDPPEVVDFFASHDFHHGPKAFPPGSDIQNMLAGIAARPDAYAPLIAAELQLPETIEGLDPGDPTDVDGFRRKYRLLDHGLLSRLGSERAEPLLTDLFARTLDLQSQSRAALNKAVANVPQGAEARQDPRIRRYVELKSGFQAFERRLLKQATTLRTPALIEPCLERIANADADVYITPALDYLTAFWNERPQVPERLRDLSADTNVPLPIRRQIQREVTRVETALQADPDRPR